MLLSKTGITISGKSVSTSQRSISGLDKSFNCAHGHPPLSDIYGPDKLLDRRHQPFPVALFDHQYRMGGQVPNRIEIPEFMTRLVRHSHAEKIAFVPGVEFRRRRDDARHLQKGSAQHPRRLGRGLPLELDDVRRAGTAHVSDRSINRLTSL